MANWLRTSRQWIVGSVGLTFAAVAFSSAIALTVSAGPSPSPVHGIGFSKGCASPTNVGSAYRCTFTVVNLSLSDTALDTLTITALSDIVHAHPADVPSGNILSFLTVSALAGGATCNVSGASTGGGATGNTICTLPSDSSISFALFSFYTADATDPSPLPDTATLTWQDLDDGGSSNPPVGDQTTSTGSQSTLLTTPQDVVGDATCDGFVDPLDAALILQFSAGLIASLPCPAGGDVNGDGVTNPLDATLILQFTAGLLASLPP